jgi:type II secretory ATPase GspE/PulE/Tfp pilus assembly ATPase PilB-like protein
MNCDQAKTEIIAYLKDELSEEKRARIEEHLAQCPACRQELENGRRLLEWTSAASEESVVKAVEDVINNAIKSSASDIHFEPQHDGMLLVRLRVDGVLHESARFEPVMRQGIIARLKMLGDMNVPEVRVPQDGRIPWTLGGKDYDMRVSSSPSIHGEDIVLRILDRSNILLGLDKLGFSKSDREALDRLVYAPNGMIIVTGPTGAGKTTTLYSILCEIANANKKIMTIEDPVEYLLSGVMQVQVHVKAGLRFAVALRSFLRHDPDVIMVGEMRDMETMAVAIEAALTGHLLLTTLHTNDAPSALIRMVDMGTEPFLVPASVIGVVAQRLIREVCPKCGESPEPKNVEHAMNYLGITEHEWKNGVVRVGQGCDACRGTGYKHRTGIFEILVMNHDIARLVNNRAPLAEIREAAIAGGMTTMREDAKQKVLAGITTPEEAIRVLA